VARPDQAGGRQAACTAGLRVSSHLDRLRASVDGRRPARAKTSKRSLYAHFESKDKLFLAVLDLIRELYLGRLKTPDAYAEEPAEAVRCPKYRRKVITGAAGERLKEIIREVCAERDAPIAELETMPDHVHLLVVCDPQYGIHGLVKQIKGR
jgi:hypothetical protein